MSEENTQNVYEGKPDGRQGGQNENITRFRPKYRALSDEEKELHDAIKSKAEEMEKLYEKAGGGRYQSLAFTSLEESVMWAVKQLTS